MAHLVGLALLLRNLRWLSWPAESRPDAMAEKTVTVIVPARNEEADVEACVRSLLAQEAVAMEVIAVDDHSEDRTPDILDRIASDDSRLLVIHDPPLVPGWLGKHNAMQAALERVSTDRDGCLAASRSLL